MYNYKLTIAYDGTNYSGWQIQQGALSIQQLIQEKLKIYLRDEVLVIGAGRTDAGVHARAQVAHFIYDKKIDLQRLLKSLAGLLPRDIRVKSVEYVPLTFHARYSAVNKEYHYHLHMHQVQDPFKRLYGWHIPYEMDLNLMRQATSCFLGSHDFSSFTNEAKSGAAVAKPVRTMKRIDVILEKEGVRLEFEAESFLYKMVRNLTGMLVEIGCKKRSLDEIQEVLLAKDRKRAGSCAPANGLFLSRVDYRDT